jgi:hypothetical protein
MARGDQLAQTFGTLESGIGRLVPDKVEKANASRFDVGIFRLGKQVIKRRGDADSEGLLRSGPINKASKP